MADEIHPDRIARVRSWAQVELRFRSSLVSRWLVDRNAQMRSIVAAMEAAMKLTESERME